MRAVGFASGVPQVAQASHSTARAFSDCILSPSSLMTGDQRTDKLQFVSRYDECQASPDLFSPFVQRSASACMLPRPILVRSTTASLVAEFSGTAVRR
jgi:hypothetical protein